MIEVLACLLYCDKLVIPGSNSMSRQVTICLLVQLKALKPFILKSFSIRHQMTDLKS